MRIPGVYVDIKGDITSLKNSMDQARNIVRQSSGDMSKSMNEAFSPKQVENATMSLYRNLTKVNGVSKITSDAFDSLGADLGELRKNTGLTEKEFAKLQSKMLQTKAQQAADRAFSSLARSANLSALEMAKLRLRAGDVSGAMKPLSVSVSSLSDRLFRLRNAFIGLGAGYVVQDLFETSKAAAQTNKAFVEITGSAEAAASEISFLRDVSDRLGQNFWELQDTYKGLLAASRDTTLEGQATRDAFEGLVKASATLGLSTEKTKLALYALEQMISKGKISSEELRRQMGDVLPGAFGVAAKAMGVSTSEFDKMLKAGEVFSEDFIPKFSTALKNKYSGEVDNAVAATNKWNEAIHDLKVQAASGGFLDAMTDALQDLTDLLKDQETINSLTGLATGIGEMAGHATKAAAAIMSVTNNALNGWNSLPTIVQELGIVGAVVGGAKARVALVLLAEGLGLAKELYDVVKTIGTETEAGIYQRIDDIQRDLATLSPEFDKTQIDSLNKELENLYGQLEKNAKSVLELSREGKDGFEEIQSSAEKVNDELKSTGAAVKYSKKQIKSFAKSANDYVGLWELAAAERYEVYSRELDLEIAEEEAANARKKELDEEQAQVSAKIAAEQTRMYENIQDGAADIFLDIFDDYENGWEAVTDTALDLFKKMLAEMAAQAIMQPVIVPIVQSMQGALGIGGSSTTGLGSGIGGMLGQGLSAYSAGSSLGLWGAGGAGSLAGTAAGTYAGGSYLSALMGSQFGTLPTGVGTMLAADGSAAGTMYGVGGAASGLSYGSLLGAGAIGSIGYSILADPLGLPTSDWSGLTAGLGSAGGYALGSGISALGAFGGPVGILAGALLGGGLGGLIGGEDLPHKFRTEYGLDINNLLSDDMGDISYMRAAGSNESGYDDIRTQMEDAIDSVYIPQIEQLQGFLDAAEAAGIDVEKTLGDLASFSSHETVSSRNHIEEGIETTMERIAADFERYTSDVVSAVLPEYNNAVIGSLTDSFSEYRSYMNDDLAAEIQSEIDKLDTNTTTLEAYNANASAIDNISNYISGVVAAVDSMNAEFQDVIDKSTLSDSEYDIKQINAEYDEYRKQLEAIGVSVDTVTKLEQARDFELQALANAEAQTLAAEVEAATNAAVSIGETIENSLAKLTLSDTEYSILQANQSFEETAAALAEYADATGNSYDDLIDKAARVRDLTVEALSSQESAAMATLDTTNLSTGASTSSAAASEWSGLAETIGGSLSDMLFSSSNPDSASSRLQDMWSTIEDIDVSSYAGASEKQSMLSDYLSLAQETYDRPSGEYQGVYDQVYGAFTDLQDTSEKNRDEELANSKRQTEILEMIAENTSETSETTINIDVGMTNQQIINTVLKAMKSNTGRVIIQQAAVGK